MFEFSKKNGKLKIIISLFFYFFFSNSKKKAWNLFHQLSNLVQGVAGEKPKLNCDFYAWFVDPRVKGTGFAPHRDHLENSPEDSFNENGLPRNCTLWVSLTDATPSNSCLHVLPARFDPCYANPETYNTNPAEFMGELDRVHHIRALPAPAGLIFLQ